MKNPLRGFLRLTVLLRTGLVLTVLAALFWLFGVNGGALAQSKSVVVERRDGEMTILPNGDVQVAETWVVDFEGGPFHFAFRDFDMTRIEDITDIRLSEDDRAFTQATTQAPATCNVERSPGSTKVTWYFDETSNRSRTFQLAYTLHGVIRQYPGGDQLWWTFIEGDRAYVIRSSHVVVHLPAPVAAENLKIESYPGTAERIDDNTVAFDGDSFMSDATFILRIQFPHGLITAAAPTWQSADDSARQKLEQAQAQQQAQEAELQAALKAQTDLQNFQQLAGGVIVLVGGLLAALVFYFVRIRQTPIALGAEFLNAPPDALPPGMAGALVDGHTNDIHVIATFVDMARRGILKMSERKGKHVFTRARNLKSKMPLRAYEQTILDRIFLNKDTRSLSSPGDMQVIGQNRREIQDAITRELVHDGYFDTAVLLDNSYIVPRSRSMRQAFVILLAAGVLFGFVALRGGMLSPYTLFLIAAVVIVAFVFYLLFRLKPHTTRRGAQSAANWRAFKRYLQNIQRYTQVEQAQSQFEKYLPYAVTFGAVREWLDAFAETNTPAPAWYAAPDTAPREPSSDTLSRDETAPHSSVSQTHSPTVSTGGAYTPPSLNKMADDSFANLNSMSAGFMSMLNGAAAALNTPAPSSTRSSSHSGDSGSSSSSSSDWSSSSSSDWSSSSSSSDSWSGGGSSDSGGSSGGGSSGFG